MHYFLLSAPWAVLCYYAEDLRLKLPLQVPRGPGVPHGTNHPGGAPLSVLEGPSHPHLCPKWAARECVPSPGPDHPSPGHPLRARPSLPADLR